MSFAEAVEALRLGDEAWETAARPAAVSAWRRALRAATEPACAEVACKAVEAMAHLRLVHQEGNLAPLWREPAWTRALSVCPPSEPWCALADADRVLLLPAFAGGDPSAAAALLRGADGRPELAADVARRERWAAGGRPAGPGTWTLAVGLAAAPGQGFGGAVRFVHPDLGGAEHRLGVSAFGNSAGEAGVSLGFVDARYHTATTLSIAHVQRYAWVEDEALAFPTDRAEVGFEVPWRVGAFVVAGGGTALAEDPGPPGSAGVAPATATFFGEPDRVVAAGPRLRLQALARRLRAGVSGRVLADLDGAAPHTLLGAEVALHQPVARGVFASRVGGEWAPDEAAWFLLPSVGGTTLLRGLPAGRFRAEAVGSAQVELRYPLVGPLNGAVFVDSAWVGEPVVSAGAGLRLVLPPERDNTTRLDVGFSPHGWGVVLAFGEAF